MAPIREESTADILIIECIDSTTCLICKKGNIKIKQINQYPRVVEVYPLAETRIKAFLLDTNEDWYNTIKDVDLKGKQFQYHDACFKKATRKVRYAAMNPSTATMEWERVCEFVD